jgi:alpha-L-rhamnosidase
MSVISLLLGLVAGAPPAATVPARAAVAALRAEYKVDPIGIDAARPRLSWKLHHDGRGVRQTAYHLELPGPLLPANL